MNNKIELDHEFIYPDDPHLLKQHHQMIKMIALFSIPVIGWIILLIILIGEWAWKKIRIGRLIFLMIWHNFKQWAGGPFTSK